MASSVVGSLPSFTYTSGPTMPFGQDLETLAIATVGVQTGIVAHAGGGQSAAFQIATGPGFVKVSTTATTADSILLPPSLPGNWFWINNGGAQQLDIYATPNANPNNGTTLDKIVPNNSATANSNTTAITLATGICSLFVCFDIGLWKQVV